MLPRDARLVAAGRVLQRAGTFSDQPPGTAFWYENSNGLAASVSGLVGSMFSPQPAQ